MNTTHIKTKPSIYLSGSIEYSKSYNIWRKKMLKDLHRQYRVIIPDKADCPFDKVDPEFKEWIRDNTVMKDMVNVATSQYFFVKIDKAVLKGAGTISEITTACWLGKDMMVMLDGVKAVSLPTWMLGCLAGAQFVESIDEAIVVYKEKAREIKSQKTEKPPEQEK
jgi:hypothetical protein